MTLVTCVFQDFVNSTKRPFPSELELVEFKEKTEETREKINKSLSELTDGGYSLTLGMLFASLEKDLYSCDNSLEVNTLWKKTRPTIWIHED